MKAQAILKNVDSESYKRVIVRNLNRILDIRIIDFDAERGLLQFLYHGPKAFEQVKKELKRIGHPILGYADEQNGTLANISETQGNSLNFNVMA